VNRRTVSPVLIQIIFVTLVFGIALYLRISLPYDRIFVDDWIKLSATDPYFFMRHVDNIMRHFPDGISFDPYMRFPSGYIVSGIPFAYLIAWITWLVGLGAPTQHTIDSVAVFFPAIVAALSVIPVYFIGKVLFNRWAGVIAAGLIAILPGESLSTTILGYTDRNSLELLLTCITMLFFILAVKNARSGQFTFSDLLHDKISAYIKPFIYSILSGAFLGIFLIFWRGAFIIAFIILLYVIIQSIHDFFKIKRLDYIVFSSFIIFLVALLIYAPFNGGTLYLLMLIACLLTALILYLIAVLIMSRNLKRYYMVIGLVICFLIGVVLIYIINPGIMKTAVGILGLFIPDETRTTILEMQPFLFPGNEFSLSIVWSNFTTSSILFVIALGIMIYQSIRKGDPDKTLLITWSIVLLAATLALRRFALLLTVNIVLLSAWLACIVLNTFRSSQRAAAPAISAEPANKHLKAKKARREEKNKKRKTYSNKHIYEIIIICAILLIAFLPNIGPAIVNASEAIYTPEDAWYDSLLWLKENSPEPFGDADFYYQQYTKPYKYPDTAYSILSWWDYGYLITRIAQRPTICDPGGGQRNLAAAFFTGQDETTASKIAEKLGSKYIVMDYSLVTEKFHSIASYAEKSRNDFFEFCYQDKPDTMTQIALFYPEYFRTMGVRLFNFDGAAFTPLNTQVFLLEERNSRGKTYKQVMDQRTFETYDEAVAFINKQDSSNWKIASTDPFISPITLNSLENYDLIHYAGNAIQHNQLGLIPKIKIFEYIK